MRFAHLFLTAGALGTLFTASTARAEGLDDCGNIFFEGSGQVTCEVYVDPGECKLECEPIAFEAQCAADLTVGCNGQCNATADIGCTGTCQGTCEADCAGGEFDCKATCEGNCTADCSGQCSGSANGTECNASCKATCQAECSAGCEVSAPDCMAQCTGCCQGQCKAEANIDCQIDCQASGYVDCEASLQGGCEGSCDAPEGAVFCDGQWIDASNVDSCVAAIEAAFQIEVEYHASAECSGNTCTAEAGASCAMSPESSSSSAFGSAAFLLGLASAGLTVARRLRKNQK